MRKSVSKKTKEVIEKHIGEMNHSSSIMELTRSGARMMLQIAIEEELSAFLDRDYYERRTTQKGFRSGYKPRTIKIGCGDIQINMPQIRDADFPFHSNILPPYLTRMTELEETIPLLYLHGLSTRRVKKAVGKFLGKRGLSHQNVIRISNKIVNEFYAPSYEHALEGIELFKKDWGKKYPSALECLVDDIKRCLTYYN
jgi:transposase-like protein